MKFRQRMMSLALALVMMFSLVVSANAADTRTPITAYLNYNITIQYNGKAQVLSDVNGNQVYPVSYNGTTYVPIRAIGYLLGLSVDWDGATQTVLLDTPSTGTAPAVAAKPDSPVKKGTKEIKTYIEPGITVKYNGEAQAMKDAAGNTVYPVLYEGTTYLPIRAVSNMLGVGVDWDGATQTVLLNSESNAAGNGSVIISPDSATVDKFFKEHGLTGVASSHEYKIIFDKTTVERIRQGMEQFEYPDYAIEAAVAEFEKNGPNGDDGEFIYEFSLNKKDVFKTSDDAQAIDTTHVANDYVDIDLSTANDGYVRVKLTKQVSETVDCRINGANADNNSSKNQRLKLNQWVNFSLLSKSDYYQLTVCSALWFDFNVAFIATVENPDGFALAPHVYVDFENAPKAVAKAEELTKNCKTDAEKITAVFEFVAKTIKYDYKMIADEDSGKISSHDRNLNPDHILDTKTGVCQHYAVLMAAMLRSQGIPCKVVSGGVYTGKTDKSYNGTPGWGDHAWVSVRPDTKGLDMTRLGAGHDEDGWIRLDPTWGATSYGRSQAAIDKNHETRYAY